MRKDKGEMCVPTPQVIWLWLWLFYEKHTTALTISKDLTVLLLELQSKHENIESLMIWFDLLQDIRADPG